MTHVNTPQSKSFPCDGAAGAELLSSPPRGTGVGPRVFGPLILEVVEDVGYMRLMRLNISVSTEWSWPA
jgi:hypothetical protein